MGRRGINLYTRRVTRVYRHRVYPRCSSLTMAQRRYTTCRRGIDLKSNRVLTLCSKLPWYKRWWNTIKGWFGSKPTNCIKGLYDLKIEGVELKNKVNTCSSGKAKLCRCKDLARYLRWWNTVKGWFNSKPTNCNPKLKVVNESSIDLYRRRWRTSRRRAGVRRYYRRRHHVVDLK